MARKFFKEQNEPIPAIVFELNAPEGFVEITDSNEIKQLYIIEYKNRKKDGQEFVVNFTADLYIDIINGVYTSVEAFSLETHISALYDNLNNGWWLTAQNTNANLSLSGIYNQAMKDSIQSIIDAYVADNY